ncbi:MAG: flagellar brake protein [Spirochaetaceae bacterium]|nr:MAG: flagellar brake protein [Spirochaetaceae bacterium]
MVYNLPYLLWSLTPLQQNNPFGEFGQTDPRATLIMMIFIGILVLVGVVSAILGGGSKSSGTEARFSARRFRREAKKIGLDRERCKLMLHLIRRYNTKVPMRLLRHAGYLDSFIQQALEDVRAASLPDTVREHRVFEIFQLKRIITNSIEASGVARSSKSLRIGSELTLGIGNQWYESELLTSVAAHLAVSVPETDKGEQLRIEKGTPVKAKAISEQGQVYQFASRVLGYGVHRKTPVMYLDHTQKMQKVQNRRHQRRELDAPVYLYPVSVVTSGKGKKARRSAVVNKEQRRLGRMIDLSAGGCAVQSRMPLAASTLVRVDFQTEDRTMITVYGKVLRLERAGYQGGIMRIKFTRVSREHVNRIQSFVYGYEGEE